MPSGSASLAVANARAVTVPTVPSFGVTRTVTVGLAPAETVPRPQETMPEAWTHVGEPGVEEVKVTPSESATVSQTPEAAPVPWFVTVATYVSVAPCATGSGESVRPTARSAVPSVQSSCPCVPSFTLKKRLAPATRASHGLPCPAPGLASRTRNVPAGVPSLFQSSSPDVPSLAAKKNVDPTAATGRGIDEALPEAMSATRYVKSGVPSLVQSSIPPVPSCARKKRRPPTARRPAGVE